MIEPSFLSATRTAYDAIVDRYAEFAGAKFAEMPLVRAMLTPFAELVGASGGRVADLGCGPGHVTAHLSTLGLDVLGVDLSPEMVALARRTYPGLRFEEGSMFALDLPDGALGGVLSNYSIIHTPPERIPEVFAEFSRVLAPGGHLLIGFQAHEDPSASPEAFDHVVALAYRWPPDRIAGLLREAGIAEVARMVIAPEEDEKRGFPHAFVLARKPAALP
ncbi:class I SAM-dependent DNA methyltransferase [Streptosporangium sp. NPDC004379]|uniref:class I SAM-dependent DNA methyltransferase n=1 Tax=Streptosporangium sp. NPDC004379 TaxID=3366189 RepID=UPI003694D495